MNKSCIMTFTLFSVLFLAAGCGKSSPPASLSAEAADQIIDFPHYYEARMDKVTFQTELCVPEEVDLSVLTEHAAKQKLPDMETVKKIFMKNLEGKEPKEEYSENNVPNRDGIKMDWYHILTKDLFGLSVDIGIRYNTSEEIYYQAAMEYDPNGNLTEAYSRSQKLEGMDREDYIQKAETVLESVGYAGEMKADCIALPHDLLEQKESWKDHEGNAQPDSYKEAWKKEDDAYFMLMHQTLQNLPVFHQFLYPDNTDLDTPIWILISRRGLELFQVNYYFDFEEKEKPLKLAEFETIASKIASKYQELLTESVYTVTKAVLYQAVIKTEPGKYQVTPAWFVDITEYANEGEDSFSVLIDAVTGEEYVL